MKLMFTRDDLIHIQICYIMYIYYTNFNNIINFNKLKIKLHKNDKNINHTILKTILFKKKKTVCLIKLQLIVKTLNQYFVFRTLYSKINTVHHIRFLQTIK
jgi:hypothetical protein